MFNKINRTTFNDDNNKNNIPKERSHYICIPAIDIDSVLKIDQNLIESMEKCLTILI